MNCFRFVPLGQPIVDRSVSTAFLLHVLRLSRSKVTDLLSIGLIETRKGRRQGETNTTRSGHKFSYQMKKSYPRKRATNIKKTKRIEMTTSHHHLKYHQQINAVLACSLKTKQTRREFYKLTLFLSFNLPLATTTTAPPKPEKFDPIPPQGASRSDKPGSHFIGSYRGVLIGAGATANNFILMREH